MSSESDNEWNLVHSHVDAAPGEPHAEAHPDDDILSNTSSSDELAEFSFRSASSGASGGGGGGGGAAARTVSDSLDTLTGSRTVERPKPAAAREPPSGPAASGTRWRGRWTQRWAPPWGSPSLSTWQVVLLTSLVSVALSLGAQKYWSLSVGGFDGGSSRSGVIRSGGDAINVVYSDLGFLTTHSANRGADAAVGNAWKPTGKFYVDFDNRIAYPMPEEDMVGWRRCKADSMIAWYMIKSKTLALLKSETARSLTDAYRDTRVLVTDLVTDQVARLWERLSTVGHAAMTSGAEWAETCQLRTLQLAHVCRVRTMQWAKTCHEQTLILAKACHVRTVNLANACHRSLAKLHQRVLLHSHKLNVRKRWLRTLKGVKHYSKNMHRRALQWQRRTASALKSAKARN